MGCVFFFGLPLMEGLAVTRVINLVGSPAASLVFAWQRKIDWTEASLLSLAALAGGWTGALLALRLGPQIVRRLLFAVTMVLVGKLVCDGWGWGPSQDSHRNDLNLRGYERHIGACPAGSSWVGEGISGLRTRLRQGRKFEATRTEG